MTIAATGIILSIGTPLFSRVPIKKNANFF
jgi:hypothetical protein